ncbi:DinB family protein [Pseudalkalibacillus decolorationis]|uniref:DinB family protein n=1 Tax=Pseudalkalibacillus decolorationis TaxID=163879 RepID=UPI0021483893|nr:DinB family protein [Pseudalkalibacillus decolorationis]
MSQLVIKQFEMTRSWFIEVAESVPRGITNIQPQGFNNNIHWHIGHVLTSADQIMFGLHHNKSYLPTVYVELFNRGTYPSDWGGDVPSVEELITQLKDQWVRLQQIPAEQLTDTLKEPFIGLETLGEVAGFAIVHESIHIGKIQEMKRIIEYAETTN